MVVTSLIAAGRLQVPAAGGNNHLLRQTGFRENVHWHSQQRQSVLKV
jgi:hypothetical protein